MHADRAKNFLLLLATNVISKGAWSVALVLLLHALGPEQYGKLVTLWSLGAIASSFTDLGTSQSLLRDGTRRPELARPLAGRVTLLQLVITLIVAIPLIHAAMHKMDIGTTETVTLLLAVTGILAPLVDRFQVLFTVFSQIANQYRVFALLRSIHFLIILAGFFLLWETGGTLLDYSLSYFVIILVTATIVGTATWRLLPNHTPIDNDARSLRSTINLLRSGYPFLFIAILTMAYGRIEVAILGFMGQNSLAGAFHAIYQLVLLVYSISGIFFTVVYPRLYQHEGNLSALRMDYRDTVQWLSLLAWSAAPLMWLYSREILELIGGEPMIASAPLLQVMAFMVALLPVSAALNFLLPLDQLWKRVICDVAGITFTVLGTLIAIQYGRADMVGLVAVTGYAIAILMANLLLAKTIGQTIVTSLFEWLRLAPLSLASTALVHNLEWHWLLGSMAYLFLFSMILLVTHHPVALRILRAPLFRNKTKRLNQHPIHRTYQ